jgi:peptidoglycan/LPS O-acetylase OafA/YrhL
MKDKIEIIDFIKGYSIISIVLFHYCQGIELPPLLSKSINFGGTGIHTFLFASGFGLFLSNLKKPLGYGNFLKKRFSKIYVPYIIIVTISALISLWIPIYENNWNNYFSHVFLYKMFDSHLIGTYGYQLWFISTIIQFYLIFPLIAKARQWLPGKSFLLTGLFISIAWAFIILLLNKEGERNWNSFFLMYLWEFMLGMYCADIYVKKGVAFWKIKRSWLIITCVTGLILYSALAILYGRIGRTLNDIPALFGYASLCILIYGLHIVAINRFILFTARISFSIFLIHFLILNLVLSGSSVLGINSTSFAACLSLILCYLISIPLQKFFDYVTDSLLVGSKIQTKNIEFVSSQE